MYYIKQKTKSPGLIFTYYSLKKKLPLKYVKLSCFFIIKLKFLILKFNYFLPSIQIKPNNQTKHKQYK